MSRTPRFVLACAGGCVVALFALMALAYYVGPARWLDAAALDGFISLGRPDVNRVAEHFVHACDTIPYAPIALATIAIALAARGLRTGAAVGLLLVGANVSTQLLKPALSYHRELYYTDWHINNMADASFPSGHSTAAMALALAVVIAVPRAYRPLAAALGALFTVAVTFSVLVLSWHMPSDIVGGYLMATAWCLTALAALRYANERWPEQGTMRQAAREALPAPSVADIARVGVAFATGAVLAAATQADRLATFADQHTAFLAVAGAIAVSAAVLLTAVAVLSSRQNT